MRKMPRGLHLITGLILVGLSTGIQAEKTGSLKAMMPWDGEGTVHSIGVDKLLFMGAFEGILYIEKAEGELDAAFARCPATQEIDVKSKTTSASGYCDSTASDSETVFAKWTCKGEVGVCKGTFTLTGGTGRFEGITGSSDLLVRSVLATLAVGMGSGDVVRATSGLAVLPELSYRMPAAE